MVRTQIQLTDEQANALRRLAVTRNETIAELVRQGVEILLRTISSISHDEQRNRAIAIAGSFHSKKGDLSRLHDKYLVEAYSK